MASWFENLGGPTVLIFVGAVLSAGGALWASHQQTRFERELRIKSDEIAQLNRELANFVIGGDSFCYFAIGSLDAVTDTGMLTVIHRGKYHLYDVHARMVDLQKFDEVKSKLSFDTMKYTDINVSVGNLIPGHASMLRQVNLGSGDTRGFNVFFTARNGSFTQLLRYEKVAGRWLHATKVERGEQVLFEQVDPEFPRNRNGEVEW